MKTPRPLAAVSRRLRRLWGRGSSAPAVVPGVFCPCCRTSGTAYIPLSYTANGICESCGSYHRHRLLMLYLERETDFLRRREPARLLHVAPEKCITGRLRERSSLRYVSTDRCAAGYDYRDHALSARSDILALPFGDAAFDVILCNHVFEHVDDDHAAMREIRRVLGRGGWAVLMVPLTPNTETFEDRTVTDPEKRTELYGQFDHVRLYGLDYRARLEMAGFVVDMIDYASRFDADETREFGLRQGVDDMIVVCRPAEQLR